MSNLFDLLDKEIDDIADLPAFKVPDTGVYKLTVVHEPKEINKKPAMVAKFTVREIVELADSAIPEADRAKAGDKFDVAYILQNESGEDSEMGWGRWKEHTKPFSAHFGITNLRALCEGPMAQPVDITATVKKVERKSEKGVFDARVSNVTID